MTPVTWPAAVACRLCVRRPLAPRHWSREHYACKVIDLQVLGRHNGDDVQWFVRPSVVRQVTSSG